MNKQDCPDINIFYIFNVNIQLFGDNFRITKWTFCLCTIKYFITFTIRFSEYILIYFAV